VSDLHPVETTVAVAKDDPKIALANTAPSTGASRGRWLAAMVREVNGNKYPFPRNRAELDAMMGFLDDEGFTAILEANSRLNARPEGEDISENERAKN
jgi:hypothetical protein